MRIIDVEDEDLESELTTAQQETLPVMTVVVVVATRACKGK